MGSGRWSLARLPTTHLLPCGPIHWGPGVGDPCPTRFRGGGGQGKVRNSAAETTIGLYTALVEAAQISCVVWSQFRIKQKVTHRYFKKEEKEVKGVEGGQKDGLCTFVNPFEIVSVCGPKLLSRDLSQLFPSFTFPTFSFWNSLNPQKTYKSSTKAPLFYLDFLHFNIWSVLVLSPHLHTYIFFSQTIWK